jgi:hypothetical protein
MPFQPRDLVSKSPQVRLVAPLTNRRRWVHRLVAPVKEESVQAVEESLRLVGSVGGMVYLVGTQCTCV